jgi:hypothetical protein
MVRSNGMMDHIARLQSTLTPIAPATKKRVPAGDRNPFVDQFPSDDFPSEDGPYRAMSDADVRRHKQTCWLYYGVLALILLAAFIGR